MALMIDPFWPREGHKNTMVIATVVVVSGMCYLCGCTGPFFLRRLGVPMNIDVKDGTLQHRRTVLQQAHRIVELIGGFNRNEAPQRVISAPATCTGNGILRRQTSPDGLEHPADREDFRRQTSPPHFSFQLQDSLGPRPP